MKDRNEKQDIHEYATRVRNAIGNIESSGMPEQDKEAVIRFGDVLRSQGVSLGRVAKYLNHLKVLSCQLVDLRGRGLLEAQYGEVQSLASWLNASTYTPHTKRDFIITMKRFYQWVRAPEAEYPKWRRRHRYPEEVEDLSIALKLSDRRLPSDLLSEEDVRVLLFAAGHPMVRAYVAFSDEVGPRIGEALSMRVKDLTNDGTDVICRLRGKTGERAIYLVKSVSILSQWLDIHPFKSNPDAPLWLNLSNNNAKERWTYSASLKMLRNLAKKADLRKRIYAHLFRHSAASRDARAGFTEAQLCLKYGWVLGSRMPRVYLHLAGTDLRQKIMEVYGGKEVEKPKPQTVRCPRCSASNHPSQNYCFTCGSPLEPGAKTVELEEMKKELSEIRETLRALLSRRP
jgi:integrase